MTLVLKNPVFTQDVPDKGFTKGHVRFISSSLLLKDIELCTFAASISSALLYEKLQASGTTLIVNLTKNSLQIDVLARYENDGLDLQWEIKPGDTNKLNEVYDRIQSKTFMLMNESKKSSEELSKPAQAQSADVKKSKPMPIPESTHEPTTKQEEEKEDYLVKQLHRIP